MIAILNSFPKHPSEIQTEREWWNSILSQHLIWAKKNSFNPPNQCKGGSARTFLHWEPDAQGSEGLPVWRERQSCWNLAPAFTCLATVHTTLFSQRCLESQCRIDYYIYMGYFSFQRFHKPPYLGHSSIKIWEIFETESYFMVRDELGLKASRCSQSLWNPASLCPWWRLEHTHNSFQIWFLSKWCPLKLHLNTPNDPQLLG